MKALEVVEGIKRERHLGSTALAWMVLEAYRSLAEESRDLKRDISTLSQKIRYARPAMPLINRFNEEVVRRVKAFKLDELLNACRDVELTYRAMMDKLVETAGKELSIYKSVTTISHSGTVLNILKKTENIENVFVLESRPMREGLVMASELKDVKKVTVCVDAAAGYAVDSSDVVLVGGDAVFSDGSFAGKVGVKMLALLAWDSGKPFYVACDTWKYSDRFENEFGLAEDVHGIAGVNVLAPVFERVDGRLVYAYITEKGVFKPTSLSSVI